MSDRRRPRLRMAKAEIAQSPSRGDVKTRHLDVRVDPVFLRVLQFVAQRQAQTPSDFARLGLYDVCYEAAGEKAVAAVIDAIKQDPRVSNRELERIANKADDE